MLGLTIKADRMQYWEACLLPLTPIDLSPRENELNMRKRNDHQILTQSFTVCYRGLPPPGDF